MKTLVLCLAWCSIHTISCQYTFKMTWKKITFQILDLQSRNNEYEQSEELTRFLWSEFNWELRLILCVMPANFSKLNSCLTEKKQMISPKQKTLRAQESRNASFMLKQCTPLNSSVVQDVTIISHKTDNRRRSAEIQVGLLFKAKDLGFSEKDGVGAEQTNTS